MPISPGLGYTTASTANKTPGRLLQGMHQIPLHGCSFRGILVYKPQRDGEVAPPIMQDGFLSKAAISLERVN
jgi:hypothetical protein